MGGVATGELERAVSERLRVIESGERSARSRGSGRRLPGRAARRGPAAQFPAGRRPLARRGKPCGAAPGEVCLARRRGLCSAYELAVAIGVGFCRRGGRVPSGSFGFLHIGCYRRWVLPRGGRAGDRGLPSRAGLRAVRDRLRDDRGGSGPSTPTLTSALPCARSFVRRRADARKSCRGSGDGRADVRLRFAPDFAGRWDFRIISNLESAAKKTGSFDGRSATDPRIRRVFNTRYFKYANSLTPHYWLGDTMLNFGLGSPGRRSARSSIRGSSKSLRICADWRWVRRQCGQRIPLAR